MEKPPTKQEEGPPAEAAIKKEGEEKKVEETPVVDEKTKEEYKALIEKGLKADEEAAMRYLAFQNKLREQQLKQDTAKMEEAESGTKK